MRIPECPEKTYDEAFRKCHNQTPHHSRSWWELNPHPTVGDKLVVLKADVHTIPPGVALLVTDLHHIIASLTWSPDARLESWRPGFDIPSRCESFPRLGHTCDLKH